jgi:hypothetical protein
MGAAEELTDVSETDIKSSDLDSSADYGWSVLPSSPRVEDAPTTYSLGGIGEGMGTLHVREVEDESLAYDWTVVYEFIAPGEKEPVSSILGEDDEYGEPDIHAVDLPNNSFDSRDAAERYAEIMVEEQDIGELLEGYGIQPPETRMP